MRFYTHLQAVFVVLFFTAFLLALTDSKVREIPSDVCHSFPRAYGLLTVLQGLPQPDRVGQQPMRGSSHPLSVSGPESTHISMVVAELQAASDAVSPGRPIAKMTAVVLATGILFGLGMGL